MNILYPMARMPALPGRPSAVLVRWSAYRGGMPATRVALVGLLALAAAALTATFGGLVALDTRCATGSSSAARPR